MLRLRFFIWGGLIRSMISYCIRIFIYENHFNLFGIRQRIPYSHVSNNGAVTVYAREKKYNCVFISYFFFFVNDSVFINIFFKKTNCKQRAFYLYLKYGFVSLPCLISVLVTIENNLYFKFTLHTYYDTPYSLLINTTTPFKIC